jgi:hypothetical protein
MCSLVTRSDSRTTAGDGPGFARSGKGAGGATGHTRVRVERPAPEPPDAQLETGPAEPLFEVLTEQPNGHRTVIRLRAMARSAAEKTADVPDGARVLGVAEAGTGLGSGG